MEKKYNFTYQTKNLIDGKTYIGVHTTDDLDDGYIGKGIKKISTARYNAKKYGCHFSRALLKYGYENFKTEILCFFDTEAEAYKEEEFIVDQKWVDCENNYNKTIGGHRPPIHYGKGETHFNYGRKHTDAQRTANSLAKKGMHSGNKNPSYKGLVYMLVGNCPIAVFESTVEAYQKTNVNRKSISSCINGERITSKGFKWTRDVKKTQKENLKSKYEIKDNKKVWRKKNSN